MTPAKSTEKVVQEIRRKTRRRFSAEESRRISVSYSYKMCCCYLSDYDSLGDSHIANGNPQDH